MTKWQVTIGASPIVALGMLYGIKRTYVITLADDAPPSAIQEAAIARAYQDGDIEHVRVEHVRKLS